jgi:hypothetical protein
MPSPSGNWKLKIGVECQIFVIVIFFNCGRVLKFGAHSRCESINFVKSHFGKRNLWPVEHFFEHFCHHFWVGLLLHPKLMTNMLKKGFIIPKWLLTKSILYKGALTEKKIIFCDFHCFQIWFLCRLKKSKQTFNTKFVIRHSVQMTWTKHKLQKWQGMYLLQLS